MNGFIKTLLSSALLLFAYAGAAMAVGPVEIDTAGYLGEWTLDYGAARHGGGPVAVEDGSHVISISGAELFFEVDSDGAVTTSQNPGAATGGPRTLTFRTHAIEIDPAAFDGRWRISAGATLDLSGPQTVTLVAGLGFYNLSVGATGGFGFDVSEDGLVTLHREQAGTGGPRTLRFGN